MQPRYPNCVVYSDNKGQWILYTDHSFEMVVAFFTTKEDAEAARGFFSKGT